MQIYKFFTNSKFKPENNSLENAAECLNKLLAANSPELRQSLVNLGPLPA